jgi:hypothetical protein
LTLWTRETSGGDIHEKDGVILINVCDPRRDIGHDLNDRLHGRPELPPTRHSDSNRVP